MLKSLFSGVSGLQSHQVAMDVESNNIANVNTIGFKYSRANFSDLLAQTNQIATAPQGQLGGKNAVQVGLGTTVDSVTRIHTQGSIQNSDKNTDMAIQGDGFFVVSADNGSSYKYTRSGDFKFDAAGNFVDNNGFIAQGWLRDPVTGALDASSSPLENINIPAGLTTPAEPTGEVTIKANLNSDNVVQNFSPTYSIDYLRNITLPNGQVLAPGSTEYGNYTEDMKVMFNEQGQNLLLSDGQGIWASFEEATVDQAGMTAIFTPVPAIATVSFTLDDGTTIPASYTPLVGDTAADVITGLQRSINNISSTTGITSAYDATSDTMTLTNANDDENASHNVIIDAANTTPAGLAFVGPLATTAYSYTYDSNAPEASTLIQAGGPKIFRTMADLRTALQEQANLDRDGQGVIESDVRVEISDRGEIVVTNNAWTGAEDNLLAPGTDEYTVALAVTGYSDPANNITESVYFTQSMSSLNGHLPLGIGAITSQGFNAATHASTLDIFDSLGSKHSLRMEFRKTEVGGTSGSTWRLNISVPEGEEIDTIQPLNEYYRSVQFANDGSLESPSGFNVYYTANNGSAPNQRINIDLGTVAGFNGLTSFNSPSATSGLSQDGFTGGDLLGIRIDQSGTLVGSFSNGRSFGLAQVGMAKFVNNEGLAADGGNVYLQSANSGDAIVGTAASGGRGFIQSSALEASNVDLSRSLTQLIIIQRGYQANGKTITTSDQLLNTLINLKN